MRRWTRNALPAPVVARAVLWLNDGTMRLVLVRHGIAIDREDPDCPPEAERFLTKEGAARTREAMKGLRALEVRADLIFTSPFTRAIQTAELAAAALGCDPRRIGPTDALLPDAEPSRLFAALSGCDAAGVVCCGHAPHVDRAVAFAVGAAEPFTSLKKAGAAAIETDPARPGEGLLLWVATPKLLRQLGRSVGPVSRR